MQIQLLNQELLLGHRGMGMLRRYVYLLALLATLQAGCDTSQQSVESQRQSAQNSATPAFSSPDGQRHDPGVLVNSSNSAESILAACVEQYRKLHSYQDQATVELRYSLEGQPTVDQAPMSVAWDQTGRIGLRVYSLSAGPTRSGRWRLKLEANREELQGQVISRHLPEKLDFSWLLHDPVVREEMAIGLAGFPPQLDLLLSSEPLSGLLKNASSISLGANTEIEGRACWTVVVQLNQLVYQLAIEQQTSLLRRIQLPTQILPPAILQDDRIHNPQLLVDFQQIQINHSIAWSGFEVDLKPNDLEVDRFVPRPPKVNLVGYGKMAPAFQLREPTGQVGYDSRPQAQRKASVLMWLADHASSRIAVEQLTRAMQTLQQEGLTSENIEIVSVWAEPKAPGGLSFSQLQSEWKLPGRLVLDNAAAGRDLFQIEEAPTLIVLDTNGVLQLRDVRTNPLLDVALPTIVSRIANGENLADEIQSAQDAVEKRFRAELAMASVSDVANLNQDNSQLTVYPPGKVRLNETGRKSFPARVRSLFQDSNETPWVLLADGSLNRLGATLAVEKSFQTSWGQSAEPLVQIIPSADGRLFASFALDNTLRGRRIQLLDTKSGIETQFNLPDGCAVVDIGWLGRVLAVIADSKRLFLLNWDTQERFSGDCPQQPISLLDSSKSVVLQDGAIEPIEMGDSRVEMPKNKVTKAVSTPTIKARKLAFKPLMGPWSSATIDSGWQLLATGLLAESEPAVFLVNSNLEAIGYYRLPTKFNPAPLRTQAAHARSPGSGELMWAILEQTGTVHLVRGDAGWSDHFRVGDTTAGICLISAGDRLKLLLASPDEVISYQLD